MLPMLLVVREGLKTESLRIYSQKNITSYYTQKIVTMPKIFKSYLKVGTTKTHPCK